MLTTFNDPVQRAHHFFVSEIGREVEHPFVQDLKKSPEKNSLFESEWGRIGGMKMQNIMKGKLYDGSWFQLSSE